MKHTHSHRKKNTSTIHIYNIHGPLPTMPSSLPLMNCNNNTTFVVCCLLSAVHENIIVDPPNEMESHQIKCAILYARGFEHVLHGIEYIPNGIYAKSAVNLLYCLLYECCDCLCLVFDILLFCCFFFPSSSSFCFAYFQAMLVLFVFFFSTKRCENFMGFSFFINFVLCKNNVFPLFFVLIKCLNIRILNVVLPTRRQTGEQANNNIQWQ